ncbi:response regulator [Salinispira pacifica]
MAGKVILIVDDEAIILMALKRELQLALGPDYSYETAMSASEAAEVIDETIADGGSIALLITDWLMPGVKGDEFLVELYRHHPEIPRLVITGHAEDDAVNSLAARVPLQGFLRKPWGARELLSAVRAALDASADGISGPPA